MRIVTCGYKFEFAAAHRLMDYAGSCAKLHGHNYQGEVWLKCQVDESTGFGVDFTKIKSVVNLILELNFDHKTLLHKDDPLQINDEGDGITLKDYHPTAEMIASDIQAQIYTAVRKNHSNVRAVKLRLFETGKFFVEPDWIYVPDGVYVKD